MLKTLLNVLTCVTLSLVAPLCNANPVTCKDYDNKPIVIKPKTITIYNNSEKSTIYPVIATSKNAVNEWLQGCFRTAEAYPTEYVYKLYVNEDTGIPPRSSVTITLPLYSELANNRYVTWWNGGRVVLADKMDGLRNKKDEKLIAPTDLNCLGQNTDCKLSMYASDVQFPDDIYAQLSEYTFGDSIIPPNQSTRLLKPENVGYNISYVDHVYMPVAIGTKNNPYIGYSGSTLSLSNFRDRLAQFLQNPLGQGWPVYNLYELKLPGGYNIFAQRSGTLPPDANVPVKPEDGFPPVLTVLSCIQGHCSEEQKKTLRHGDSIQRIQNLWASCVDWNENTNEFITQQVDCPQSLKENLQTVQRFFKQNHEQYLQLFAEGRCTQNPEAKPIPFTYWEVIKHIYGWVPFNEGCGAAANPLSDTNIPGWDHAKIQSMYIHELQYNYQQIGTNYDLVFNPYVQLIHDSNYLSMDAYAFSVDDAVGFMSELGDGLIFTVAGTNGLENQKHFNYAEGFSVAIGVPQSMVNKVNVPLIKQYGVCALNQDATNMDCHVINQNVRMPENSQIAGFRIGTVPSYPIKVRFIDLNDNVYTFVVNEPFAACPSNMASSQCPINRSKIIRKQSCIVTNNLGEKHPKSDAWCQSANPNQQQEKQLTKNFLSFSEPVDSSQP